MKAHYKEKTEYTEHFVNFFNEHYFDGTEKNDYYTKYLDNVKKMQVTTWDTNIRSLLGGKISADKEKPLIRLIAVIDFISGLTDRYCLEMFNEVYKEFVTT